MHSANPITANRYQAAWRSLPPRTRRLIASTAMMHPPTNTIPASPRAAMFSARRWPSLRTDVVLNGVVRNPVVALAQVALVVGVIDCPIEVLAGKRADRLDRVPQRIGDELRAVALVAPQRPGAAVAGPLAVLVE